MASNDSKDNGNRDPWGNPKNQGPDDLVKLFRQFFKKLNQPPSSDNGPSGTRFAGFYVGAVIAILLIIWFVAGIFVVSPAQESVVLRFGKYVTTVGPGPHWVPPLIDSRTTLNVQRVRNFSYKSEMLTKDENIVSVSLAVQYRISDPRQFLFNVVNPLQTLQQTTSSVLRQVVGSMTLNTILTTGRRELRDQVEQSLVKTLITYQTGLTITDVRLLPAKPPEAVTTAFDDAVKAREDKQRYINQSKAYSKKVISIARGKVSRMLQSANAYKKEVVLRAQGDTARYLALLKPFEKAPKVTRDRLYLDTVSAVLSHTTNVLVDTSGNNVLYLPLDQLLKQRKNFAAQGPMIDNQSSNNAGSNSNTGSSNIKSTSSYSYGESRPSYPMGENS